MKCECGLDYNPRIKADREQHKRRHYVYERGIYLASLTLAPLVTSHKRLKTYLVDSTLPNYVRSALRDEAIPQLALLADLAPFLEGFSADTKPHDLRLFLIGDGCSVVCIGATAVDFGFWRLSWNDDGSVSQMRSQQSLAMGAVIRRLWTAAMYRRQGVASELVIAATATLQRDLDSIGWELPLSRNGRHLIRRLCPDEWWGRGSGWALAQTLRGESK